MFSFYLYYLRNIIDTQTTKTKINTESRVYRTKYRSLSFRSFPHSKLQQNVRRTQIIHSRYSSSLLNTRTHALNSSGGNAFTALYLTAIDLTTSLLPCFCYTAALWASVYVIWYVSFQGGKKKKKVGEILFIFM